MQLQINNLEEIASAAHSFIAAFLPASSAGEPQETSTTVIAFYGSMGAGKTTFIRALCEGLGVQEPVTSPTFAIVNEYSSHSSIKKIFHFDFYRIRRIEEAYDMGFEDYLYSGHLCLIEWPELIEDLLPEDTIRVRITAADDGTRTLQTE